MENLQRLAIGFLGSIFYPALSLFRLARTTAILAVISLIAIPVLSLYAGLIFYQNIGLIPAFFATVVAAAVMLGFCLTVLPAIILATVIYKLITDPFKGFQIGYNDGFTAIFEYPTVRAHRQAEQAFDDFMQNEVMGIEAAHGPAFETILQQLTDATVDAARRPLSEEQYKYLEFTEVEYRTLNQAQLPVLTVTEQEILRSFKNVEVDKLLQRYAELKRLETDNCPLLLERPETMNTVLLVKQYQKNGQWLPVPGVSHIFDRELLKGYFKTNAVHPFVSSDSDPGNRDKILSPGAYINQGTAYETRYKIHNYYSSQTSNRGISQEVNALASELRGRLPKVEQTYQFQDQKNELRFAV